MKYTTKKLSQLQKELDEIIKEAGAGKLSPAEAADKILHVREEMDKVIEHLRTATK